MTCRTIVLDIVQIMVKVSLLTFYISDVKSDQWDTRSPAYHKEDDKAEAEFSPSVPDGPGPQGEDD